MARLHLLLALPSILAPLGCSSFGVTTSEMPAVAPFTASETGDAKVCVFRSGIPAPLFTTTVRDNGALVGATKDRTYFCYLAEPGVHRIVSDGTYGETEATFEAAPGRRYYVRQSWLFPAPRGHELSFLDESFAREEMAGDDYSRLVEVPAGSAVPDARPFAPAARR